MKASTHTEVYRRFTGKRESRRLRFAPLVSAGLRVALAQRWSRLLFLPPAIGTILFAFVVYAKFSVEQGMTPSALGGGTGATPGVAMMGAVASQMLQVRDLIVGFIFATGIFSLTIVGWYGAGLIAEDRRLGAHLLYFARPLTRRDYLIAKMIIVSTFSLASVLVPSLVICFVAALASPEWSFVTQQGWTILHVTLYAFVQTIVLSSVVLAISSVCSRKTFALVATVGFFMISQGIGALLAALQRDSRWLMLGPFTNLRKVCASICGVRNVPGLSLKWDTGLSWCVLSGIVLVAWIVLVFRVRRMEAVT